MLSTVLDVMAGGDPRFTAGDTRAGTWIGGLAAIIAAACYSSFLAGLGVLVAAWAVRRLIADRRDRHR